MTPNSAYILTFEQCNAATQAQVGGKCASLGAMIQAGAPIPPGFAVTTEAYLKMLACNDLDEQIRSHLEKLKPENVKGQEAVSQTIRALIEQIPMPDKVEQAIRQAYAAPAPLPKIYQKPALPDSKTPFCG